MTSAAPPNPFVAGPEDVGLSKEPHPRGLYVLFGAEMWERFSYYGMRALLVLYLVDRLKYSRDDALSLYGTYTGLVYLTPLLGGYLADRYLGQRKAVFLGGVLMALGHFAMAFEPFLYLALGLLILGNGFFKPNISTMVGQLYAPRIDAAIRPTRSSTWGSTPEHSSRRLCAGTWARASGSVGITDSRRPALVWCSGS